MPPRTRKAEPAPSDPAPRVATPEEIEAEHVRLDAQQAAEDGRRAQEAQAVTPGMFQPAIEVAKSAMSRRMDTIVEQIRRDMRELALGQQVLSEALGEVDGRAVTPGAGWTDQVQALVGMQGELKQRVDGMQRSYDNADRAIRDLNAQIQVVVGKVGALQYSDSADVRAEVEVLGVAVNELLAAQTGSMSAAMASDGFRTAGIEAGKHILSATWAVMSEVTGVGKHGDYKDGNVRYRFRAWDDVQNAVGASFRRHGVMIQSQVLDKQVEAYEVQGKRRTAVTLTIKYVFTSLVDGSTVEFEAIGESKDTSDKAHAKAMTAAAKSAISQALMLATGDEDPDQTRPGEDDAVEPNVRVPANETEAQRSAREAYEARRTQARREQQDQAAETPQPVHAGGQVDAQSQADRQAVQQTQGAGQVPAEQGMANLTQELGAHEIPHTAPAGDVPEDVQNAEPDFHGQDWQAAESDQRQAQHLLERAQAALQAARGPQLSFEKLNKIIALASSEGLMAVVVDGAQLQQHLIAIGRTVPAAPAAPHG